MNQLRQQEVYTVFDFKAWVTFEYTINTTEQIMKRINSKEIELYQ